MNRSRNLRFLLVLVGLMLFATGCEEPIGVVEFHNDSDETVLFLHATGPDPTLEVAVELAYYNPFSLKPEAVANQSFDVPWGSGTDPRPGKHEPWCVDTVYFVVKSKSGRFYQSDVHAEVPDPPLEVSDLEVLEQLGPGWCWPERETDYHFTGE